jgi:hypothetical protein
MANAVTLVAADTPAAAIVPTEAFDAVFGMSWNGQDETFDDSPAAGWKQGTQGVGYDENDTYQPRIGLDLLGEMLDANASLYARIEFTLDDMLPHVDFLQLKLRYDDGFIAYLNGVEIARANAPSAPTWNSTATLSHRDSEAMEFEAFDVTAYTDVLKLGANVLAIHGLNRRPSDNDMLIQAELLAGEFTRTPIQIDHFSPITARTFSAGAWSGATVLNVAQPGDANGDGIFSSSDLVLVLQAGQYEDDTDDNSTWSEGDWNGDGDFTTADLVLALATGTYTNGARTAKR